MIWAANIALIAGVLSVATGLRYWKRPWGKSSLAFGAAVIVITLLVAWPEVLSNFQ